MKVSEITARFPVDVRKVWEVVTNNENYAWRSDLSGIKISGDGQQFIECTKEGDSTIFTITLKQPYSRYEFDFENRYIRGHWIGVFKGLADGGTEICFMEKVEAKNFFMRIWVRLFLNLKRIQQTYIFDLQSKLGRCK